MQKKDSQHIGNIKKEELKVSLINGLIKFRELLESHEDDALDFLDDFKLNLYTDEIFVFTPNGDMKSLPRGACSIDFAYANSYAGGR